MKLSYSAGRALLSALIISIGAAMPARAMHISEGILPPSWAAGTWLLALPLILIGGFAWKKTVREKPESHALLGLVGAAVFLISAMPIPVPFVGTCSHPCGVGIAAILLGPSLSILLAAAALLLQALFMAHGGITTLGANVLSMGVAGSLTAWTTWKILRRAGVGLKPAAFAAGCLADWATYLVTAGVMAGGLAEPGEFTPLFLTIAAAFVPTQLPLGILEGAVTAGAVGLVTRRLGVDAGAGLLGRKTVAAASVTLLFLMTTTALGAENTSSGNVEKWPGIDEAVVEKHAESAGRPATKPFLPLEGDALLFAFLVAGIAGGFVAGYSWRILGEKRQPVPGVRLREEIDPR